MPKERIQLLSHHVRNIRSLYPRAEGLEKRVTMVHDAFRKMRFPGGEPLYPGITEEMSQATIKAAYAVLEGSYKEIPDRKRDDTKNFDIICYSCSNYTKKPEECRAEKIADEMSTMKNIRLYFHIGFISVPVRFKFFLLGIKERLR